MSEKEKTEAKEVEAAQATAQQAREIADAMPEDYMKERVHGQARLADLRAQRAEEIAKTVSDQTEVAHDADYIKQKQQAQSANELRKSQHEKRKEEMASLEAQVLDAAEVSTNIAREHETREKNEQKTSKVEPAAKALEEAEALPPGLERDARVAEATKDKLRAVLKERLSEELVHAASLGMGTEQDSRELVRAALEAY